MKSCKIISHTEVKAEHLGRPGCLGAKEKQLISEDDGANNFHTRIIDILPKGLIPPHQHEHEHCAYILEGECTIICGGKERIVKSGYTVFIPVNIMHSWHNKTGTYVTFLLIDA